MRKINQEKGKRREKEKDERKALANLKQLHLLRGQTCPVFLVEYVEIFRYGPQAIHSTKEGRIELS